MELGNMIFGNSRGEYLVDRNWQDMFIEHLYDMGFNGYGNIENDYLKEFVVEVKSVINEPSMKFENEIFIIMPYYWGDDEDICNLPNFVYKPTGFELNWYKYALRDSYMNQDINDQIIVDLYKEYKRLLEKLRKED